MKMITDRWEIVTDFKPLLGFILDVGPLFGYLHHAEVEGCPMLLHSIYSLYS
jgi:hypothetical protein